MRIDLNGSWKATRELGLQARAGKAGFVPEGWLDVPVPGHWQQAAGLERYTGRLLYRRSFIWDPAEVWREAVPAAGTEAGTAQPAGPAAGVALPPGSAARLRFDGVYYAAKVWLNGTFVGEHEGYFVPAAYDVTRHLRPGENVVTMEVDCPPDPDPNARRLITGILGHWEAKPPGHEPGGIWRDVWLEVCQGVTPVRLSLRAEPDRLPPAPLAPDEVERQSKHPAGVTRWHGTGGAAPEEPGSPTAEVSFQLDFTTLEDGRLRWSATVTPETFKGEAVALEGSQPFRRGYNRMSSVITLPDPRLWWTWDHGTPDLYRLTLELQVGRGPVQRLERLFGVRKVEMRSNHLYLNGRRIFVRGSHYGPAEIRLAAVRPEDHRRDLTLAREANINLLRVRAHVAAPSLYEEASRQGILLWQDFPLEGLYSRSVLEPARLQAAAMVDLLGHWPAIGIWCAHSDPVREAGPDEVSLLDRSLAAIAKLGRNWSMSTLAPAVRKEIQHHDPTRPCLDHPMDWGGLLGSVDTRVRPGWREGKVEELDRTLKLFPERARFVTEFGAPAFPGPDHARRFVRGEWPHLDWGALAEQYMYPSRTMERYVPRSLSPTFEQYLAASQWYQAYVLRYVTERFRRAKYAPCGGVLQALLTDCAPGVTASVVDYWREPKAGYLALKAAYNPLHIMAEWPRKGYQPGTPIALQVFVVNDLYRNFSGTWTWRIERGGEALAGGSRPIYLPPDRLVTVPDAIAWTVPAGAQVGAAELVLQLELDGEETITNRYGLQILSPQNG